MMANSARRVLIGGETTGFHARAEQLLPAPQFVVQKTPDARSTIELVQKTPFDVVIVEFVGEPAVIRELVKAMRWSGSPCRHATTILLCRPDELDAAESLLDSGISRILNPTAPDAVLLTALDEVLNHELRYPVRALVRINGEDLGHSGVIMTQTTNLSTTGMLVRFEKQVYLGSRFAFSLEAPGLTKAIRGGAAVIRLSHGGSERLTGFAARFSHFDGDGLGRLKAFLAAQPAPTDHDENS